MSLSRLEQETIIIFNEAEQEAEVQTLNGALRRKLEKLAAERPEACRLLRDCGEGGIRYQVPKKWIKVSASRILTDEQRRTLSERGKVAASNLTRV